MISGERKRPELNPDYCILVSKIFSPCAPLDSVATYQDHQIIIYHFQYIQLILKMEIVRCIQKHHKHLTRRPNELQVLVYNHKNKSFYQKYLKKVCHICDNQPSLVAEGVVNGRNYLVVSFKYVYIMITTFVHTARPRPDVLPPPSKPNLVSPSI